MSWWNAIPVNLRQAIVGLLAVPISLLPFWAYLTKTPEGNLLWGRAVVTINQPNLPELEKSLAESAGEIVPAYENGVMVLNYHGVGGNEASGEGSFSLTDEEFGEHLAALKAAGMQSVTTRDIVDAWNGKKELPEKAVLITFDDGRADAMMWADPLLEEAGMKATMFVISGAAERRGLYYVDWEKLEKYQSSGRWELQPHTHSLHVEHETGEGLLPALTSLKEGESIEEYKERIEADFETADALLQEHTGTRPVAFAYPFGAYGAERTNDPRIQEILRAELEERYELAFHQDEQESIPLATCEQDPYGLRRLSVEPWSGEELLTKIKEASERVEGVTCAGGGS